MYQHNTDTILHTKITILCLPTKDKHYFVVLTASGMFMGQCVELLNRTILELKHYTQNSMEKKVMIWGKLLDILVQYVIRVYGPNTVVIFDDYPDHPTTKDEARTRHSVTSTSACVSLQENLTVDISKKAIPTIL